MSMALLDVRSDLTAGSVIRGDPSAVFDAPITLYSDDGRSSLTVAGTVDTRARYSIVPANILLELGIAPQSRRRCALPCGATVDLPCARPRVMLNGKSGRPVVLFGEDGKQTIIGQSALIGLALAADPENKRFVNAVLYL